MALEKTAQIGDHGGVKCWLKNDGP